MIDPRAIDRMVTQLANGLLYRAYGSIPNDDRIPESAIDGMKRCKAQALASSAAADAIGRFPGAVEWVQSSNDYGQPVLHGTLSLLILSEEEFRIRARDILNRLHGLPKGTEPR
jgi:hypothetical protein